MVCNLVAGLAITDNTRHGRRETRNRDRGCLRGGLRGNAVRGARSRIDLRSGAQVFGIFTKQNGMIALIAIVAVMGYNRLIAPATGLPTA
jgi:hypothetical protein